MNNNGLFFFAQNIFISVHGEKSDFLEKNKVNNQIGLQR